MAVNCSVKPAALLLTAEVTTMLLRATGAVGLTDPEAVLTLPWLICVSSAPLAEAAEMSVLPATLTTIFCRSVCEMAPVLETKVVAGALFKAVLVAVGMTILPEVLPSLRLCRN